MASPSQLCGKTSEQVEAILGDEIAKVVTHAKKKQQPIVIEELDLETKKLQLRSRSMNRMLSQFSYAKFNSMITARCLLVGVTLIQVHPAYTSVMGQLKFSYGYGLSTHMGASMYIARRGLGFGERLRMKSRNSLRLPVRNRLKHSWTDWRKLNPRVFPEEYLFREDRQCPERNQGEQILQATR